MTDVTIKTAHLFNMVLEVGSMSELGKTPWGTRRIATVAGGRFIGKELSGTVLPTPAGDWLLLRSDNVLMLDVRLTLETIDKQLVYMSYRGMRHGPQWVIERLNRGEKVDPSEYYFRTTPSFETASEKYSWLNRIVCVASGRREASGPIYDVFQVL